MFVYAPSCRYPEPNSKRFTLVTGTTITMHPTGRVSCGKTHDLIDGSFHVKEESFGEGGEVVETTYYAGIKARTDGMEFYSTPDDLCGHE